MKKLIIMFVILPLAGLAQNDTLTSVINKYVIDGNSIMYVNTVDVTAKDKDEIRAIAIKRFSSNPKLSIIQASISADQIEGSFSDLSLEYRKYGMKKTNTGLWVFLPTSGTFTIQFKDGKYRVIVKGVKSVVNKDLIFDFNKDYVNKQGQLRNVDSPTSRRAYYVFGRNMDDLFDLSNVKSDW